MKQELPKIDLPGDMLVGTDLSWEVLKMYTNYPCRLKIEIFVLCMQGEIEASVDINKIHVKPFDFVSILPESIFQIHEVVGDPKIYFLGFSSEFLRNVTIPKTSMELFYLIKEKAIITLTEKVALLLEDYFSLLIKTYDFCGTKLDRSVATHLFSSIHLGLNVMYKNQTQTKTYLSKSEQISNKFKLLVMQNYHKERNVAWYAHKLKITHAHLCTTVKQMTEKTCIGIISEMVIMDAKSQLKSTHLSIQDIAYSLNFTNMSFFGKYFKRHVGMSPQEYRNM